MKLNDVATWMALVTASLCLTVTFAVYSHASEERRDAVCREVAEQLREARDRGNLSSAAYERIMNNCYRSSSGMFSRLH